MCSVDLDCYVLIIVIQACADFLRQSNSRMLISRARRSASARSLAATYEHIPLRLHPYIFPVSHPQTVDFVFSWSIPSEERSGHLFICGPTLGANHGALGDIIREVEHNKVKRSMYAETHRERSLLLEVIRASVWNANMNPVAAFVHDLAPLEHNFLDACV
jgi:trafficking protein particle complex subunit 8